MYYTNIMVNSNHKIVMGIETSCDETATAIYHADKGLLAHRLFSQQSIHAQYGGVMPEVASRDHIKKLSPLIKLTLKDANLCLLDLNAIAYTAGPGLIGSLMVGATIARSLAYGLNIKAIPVHHMEGHLLAPMLDHPAPSFPFVALLVSGGHTLLVEVLSLGDYKIIGESVDDAAGEAFDKTARLLGLSYPGGPAIAQIAKKGQAEKIVFPLPMVKKKGLNFSFSGLKTSAMTSWQKSDKSQQTKADLAKAFELAVAKTLTIKCKRALKQTRLNTLVVAGGVSANIQIRKHIQQMANNEDYQVFFPRPEFCTDNGAMIAYAGAVNLNAAQKDLSIIVKPRWPLTNKIYESC